MNWQTRLGELLDQYENEHNSEASTVAEHINDVIASNDDQDPELKQYILSALEELVGYAQQAIRVLNQPDDGTPESDLFKAAKRVIEHRTYDYLDNTSTPYIELAEAVKRIEEGNP